MRSTRSALLVAIKKIKNKRLRMQPFIFKVELESEAVTTTAAKKKNDK